MAVFDNRHSRIVAWLKVILPLAALAILSTLFLLADRRGDDRELPYSQVDIDRMVNEQRIANPNYSTVTAGGTALTLSADEVRPDEDDASRMVAGDVIGVIEPGPGTRIDVSSDWALTRDGGRVALTGDVTVRSTTGYRLDSEVLEIDTETATATSPGPVTGASPLGRIAAGGMELVETDGRYLLNFTDGVRVLYDPRRSEGEPR